MGVASGMPCDADQLTGLLDTFCLRSGERADGNGVLIEVLAACVNRAGRAVATPAEAHELLGLQN